LNTVLLQKVVRQIAEALQALHEHGIVRRELTPEFITLRDADLSVLLTDLELAKILEGGRTVSTDWKENPFVAPEVFRGECDVRTDLFSWGQILYYAATGKKPDKPPNPAAFLGVELPRAVKQVATKCVATMPKDRPGSMEDVLKAIRNWT
jgi:serine/threonine protein kinase